MRKIKSVERCLQNQRGLTFLEAMISALLMAMVASGVMWLMNGVQKRTHRLEVANARDRLTIKLIGDLMRHATYFQGSSAFSDTVSLDATGRSTTEVDRGFQGTPMYFDQNGLYRTREECPHCTGTVRVSIMRSRIPGNRHVVFELEEPNLGRRRLALETGL